MFVYVCMSVHACTVIAGVNIVCMCIWGVEWLIGASGDTGH